MTEWRSAFQKSDDGASLISELDQDMASSIDRLKSVSRTGQWMVATVDDEGEFEVTGGGDSDNTDHIHFFLTSIIRAMTYALADLQKHEEENDTEGS